MTDTAPKGRQERRGRPRPRPTSTSAPEPVTDGPGPPPRPLRAALEWAYDHLTEPTPADAVRLLAAHGVTVSPRYARQIAAQLPTTDRATETVAQFPDQIGGLGEGESVAATYRAHGDTYELITGVRGNRSWHRMVRVETDKTSGATVRRLIVNGCLELVRVELVVDLDDTTGTLTDTVTDTFYELRYTSNRDDHVLLGAARTALVRETDIADGPRKQGAWLAPLGLSAAARSDRWKHLGDLVHAMVESFTGPVTRAIETTGLVHLPGGADGRHGPLAYVPPTGQAFTAAGPTDRIRARMPAGLANTHAAAVTYDPGAPDWDGPRTRTGLDALADLIVSGHGDPGVSGLDVGQLIVSLASGYPLGDGMPPAQTTINKVGITNSGKTAWDVLVTTSQTRTLSGHLRAPFDAGPSSGTTRAGIVRHHLPFRGLTAILGDNIIRASMSTAEQMKAHTTIHAPIVNGTVGGGGAQAHGGSNGGPPGPAPAQRFRICSHVSMEALPPVGGCVMDDSILNKELIVPWRKEDRCGDDTFARLRSKSATLARNDGLRACGQMILEDPHIIVVGYAEAFAALVAEGIDVRLAETFAVNLAGVYVLDQAQERANGGAPSDLLGKVLPAAIAHARRMMDPAGWVAGDLSIVSRVESWRAAVQDLTRSGRWYWDHRRAEEMTDTDPEVIGGSPDPDDLPPGVLPEDEGWRGSALIDTRGQRIGHAIRHAPGTVGAPHEFEYRGELRPVDWRALCTAVTDLAKRHGWREGTPQEYAAALIDDGHLIRAKVHGVRLYQVDREWLHTTPDLGTDNDDTEGEG